VMTTAQMTQCTNTADDVFINSECDGSLFCICLWYNTSVPVAYDFIYDSNEWPYQIGSLVNGFEDEYDGAQMFSLLFADDAYATDLEPIVQEAAYWIYIDPVAEGFTPHVSGDDVDPVPSINVDDDTQNTWDGACDPSTEILSFTYSQDFNQSVWNGTTFIPWETHFSMTRTRTATQFQEFSTVRFIDCVTNTGAGAWPTFYYLVADELGCDSDCLRTSPSNTASQDPNNCDWSDSNGPQPWCQTQEGAEPVPGENDAPQYTVFFPSDTSNNYDASHYNFDDFYGQPGAHANVTEEELYTWGLRFSELAVDEEVCLMWFHGVTYDSPYYNFAQVIAENPSSLYEDLDIATRDKIANWKTYDCLASNPCPDGYAGVPCDEGLDRYLCDAGAWVLQDRCLENEYVLSGVCTACDTGYSNPAGDQPWGADTECTLDYSGSAVLQVSMSLLILPFFLM